MRPFPSGTAHEALIEERLVGIAAELPVSVERARAGPRIAQSLLASEELVVTEQVAEGVLRASRGAPEDCALSERTAEVLVRPSTCAGKRARIERLREVRLGRVARKALA